MKALLIAVEEESKSDFILILSGRTTDPGPLLLTSRARLSLHVPSLKAEKAHSSSSTDAIIVMVIDIVINIIIEPIIIIIILSARHHCCPIMKI